MPPKPQAPHFQAAARRRSRGESPRPRPKQVFDGQTLLKKHPSAIAEIAGGWFVKTHSGTAAKIRYVKQIAKALKVKLVVTNV